MLKMIIKRLLIPFWILSLNGLLLFSGCVSTTESVKTADTGKSAASVEEEDSSSPLPVPQIKTERENTDSSSGRDSSGTLSTPEPEDPVFPEDEHHSPAAAEIADPDLSQSVSDMNRSNTDSGEQNSESGTAVSSQKQNPPPAPRQRQMPPSSREGVEKPSSPVQPARNTAAEPAADPARKNVLLEEPLFAQPGDLIQYPFDTRGWVFNKTEPDNGGVSFLEKRNGIEGAVTFVFEAEKLGDYILEFISYDMESGTEYVKQIPVSVLNQEEFLSKIEPSDGVSGSQTGQSLYEAGQYEEVVSYYTEHSADTAADQFYFAMGEKNTGALDSAAVRLEPLLENETYRRAALEQLAELAIELEKKDLMLRLITEEDFFGLTLTPDELIKYASAAAESERTGEGISVLRFMLKNFRNYDELDRVLWLLGNLLEMPGEYRDIRNAVDVYFMILDNFPTSIYYEGAEKRIAFLKRHYILIN